MLRQLTVSSFQIVNLFLAEVYKQSKKNSHTKREDIWYISQDLVSRKLLQISKEKTNSSAMR